MSSASKVDLFLVTMSSKVNIWGGGGDCAYFEACQ